MGKRRKAPYKKRAYTRTVKKNTFAKKVTAVLQRKAEHKMVVQSTSNYMPNYSVGTPPTNSTNSKCYVIGYITK